MISTRVVRRIVHGAVIASTLTAGSSALTLADDTSRVSAAAVDENGFQIHEVESPYQAGKTQIRVLRGDKLEPLGRYPAVYVLPVESGTEHRYGDGLVEIKKHDLHNKYAAIFVAPTFSHTPWYTDHPSDPTIRQESYVVKVVVPAVEKMYPVLAGHKGRLLVGFSKSGWGAWTLLLRQPEFFGRAAAWDSPMMMERFGLFGSGVIFGTEENFKRYRVLDLLREKSDSLRDGERLIFMGYGPTPQGHQKVHALLDELKIPHQYRDGPQRNHDWHSGWVSEAVELLLTTAD